MADENTLDNNTTVVTGEAVEQQDVQTTQPDLTSDNNGDVLDSGESFESPEEEEVFDSSEDFEDYDYSEDGEEEQEDDLSDDNHEDDDSEWYDEEGNSVASEETDGNAEDKPSGENKKEQDNEQSGKSVESDVKSDRDYLSRIYEEYIPGTNEFFSAVANDAKKAVEESLGEEFDQFNPEHIARYNYFAAKSAKEREEEMRRGIEQCKRQDEEERQARIRAEQQAAYNNAAKKFNDYMGTQIKTQELADRFKEFIDTRLSNRDQRVLDEQIGKGDYSGVQKIIDSLKTGRRYERPQQRQQTPRFASQQPRQSKPSNKHHGNRVPRLSDIL